MTKIDLRVYELECEMVTRRLRRYSYDPTWDYTRNGKPSSLSRGPGWYAFSKEKDELEGIRPAWEKMAIDRIMVG